MHNFIKKSTLLVTLLVVSATVFSVCLLTFGLCASDEDFYRNIRLPEPELSVKEKALIANCKQELDQLDQEIDDIYFRDIPKECYPFRSNPALSWNAFEQDLRSRQASLNIPPIKTPSFPITPTYNPIRKVLQITPEYFLSPGEAEAAILHEVGHSYYPESQRTQNTLDAQQQVKNINGYVLPTCKSVLAGLTFTNGYRLFLRKPHLGLLGAQGALMKMINDDPVSSYITPRVATRREELAADDFANKYMSKEALLAAQYQFSKQGYLQHIEAERFKTLMPDQYAQLTKFDEGLPAPLLKLAKAGESLRYELRGITTPSHPSPKQRHAMVTQALKDRFGVEREF